MADYIDDRQFQYHVSEASLGVATHNIVALETKLAHILHGAIKGEARRTPTTFGEFKKSLNVQVS